MLPNPVTGSVASGVVLADIARCTPDDALQHLGSSANGLTPAQAEARLLAVGPNEIAHEAHHSILSELLSRSINPLNVLLLTLAARGWL
jgi:Mg2+-importing ATPase